MERKDNTIVCPAGHHLKEGRWLRDPKYIADYARFWLTDKDATHRWLYSSWLYSGTCSFAEVTGLDSLPGELLDAAVQYYQGWEQGLRHKNTMGGDGKGGFLSNDNHEGTELSLGGNGYKPLFASAMYAEAMAIAEVAEKTGRKELAAEFRAKAEVNRKSIMEHCWNEDLKFFTTEPVAGSPHAAVRELHGYAPWYFGVPTEGREPDFAQLVDAHGFLGNFGLSFVERRAKGWTIDYNGHECKWNGPSWPFATSIALTAYANWLHGESRGAETFNLLLSQYAAQHRRERNRKTEGDHRVIPWIDENCHPDKMEWIARKIIKDRPEMSAKFPKERGKDYNHSTFCDLVISGLVGFIPNGEKGFIVDPLFPAEWDYCVLENLRYRGHDIDIRWNRAAGEFTIYTDGRKVVNGKRLQKQEVMLNE